MLGKAGFSPFYNDLKDVSLEALKGHLVYTAGTACLYFPGDYHFKRIFFCY